MLEIKSLDSLLGPFAYGKPVIQGAFKSKPTDFRVYEHLGYEPSGEGEHLYCQVEKEGMETEQVVKQLAYALGISKKLISYSGLKDKQAVTQQWFSIHLPGKETPDLMESHYPFKVLSQARHHKKLKRGTHQFNQFILTLRECTGQMEGVAERLALIEAQGVPNYFGPQRFGREGNNVLLGIDILIHGKNIKNKFLRGMAISAVRSWLFNRQLADRVKQGCWRQVQSDDVMNLLGSNSIFEVDDRDQAQQRVDQKDISPAGVLFGKNVNHSHHSAELFSDEDDMQILDALHRQGSETMYRPFILYPTHLQHHISGNTIELSFHLPKGAFATSVLRELCSVL